MPLASSTKTIGAAAGGLAIVLAFAVAWLWRHEPQPKQPASTPRSASVSMPEKLPEQARKGRLILSKSQVEQALRSGTIDRPVNSLIEVGKPLHYGEFAWNDAGIPAGPTWVRIDLGSQLISVFRGADEIGTAVIVYGGDNKQTPAGKLHVLARDKDHYSSLYDAAMPYTLQLTNDGVAIHGSIVRWGAATHGCIGVPLEFARRLFDEARVGDEVMIIPPAAASALRQTS